MPFDLAKHALMYFLLPLWLLAGFSDYLCHRASKIATTSGTKESLIHLLLLAEVGIPIFLALQFEINALVIAIMLMFYFTHEATAIWDVSYAHTRREITPIEQHVHSYLAMLPLMGLLIVVLLHWGQFLALFGLGSELARFAFVDKSPPISWNYSIAIISAVILFEVLPYLEELWRCMRSPRHNFGEVIKSGRAGTLRE